jgi:methanogenic corrinoid protein MtbC1
MQPELKTLDSEGLRQFMAHRLGAVEAVTDRFYQTHGSIYAQFGQRGRDACRQDLTFHLEFLRPVLEFGMIQPMVDYLSWLNSVLAARAIPSDHLPQSLDWLGDYFREKLDPDPGEVICAALTAVRDAFLDRSNAPAPILNAPEAWPQATAFEGALLSGEQARALDLMNSCIDEGCSLSDFEQHVIQPSLYRIGEKWQGNQVTVAQEHLATAIVQSVMTIGLLRSPPPPSTGKRILLACVEGNHHAIGARMVCDAFQLAGWTVDFLGADVPTTSLVGHIVGRKYDLIGLSVSFPQQLSVVRDVIAQLTERMGVERPPIIIGGIAINRFDQLAHLVGADASCADAQSAVAYAGQTPGEKGLHGLVHA